MSEWVQCSGCGLRHIAPADGQCPRCRSQGSGTAAPTTVSVEPSAAPSMSATFPRVPVWVPDDFFAEALEVFRSPPKRHSWLWLGIASAIAFIALSVLDVALPIALMLAAVLLFHELGHYVAMRLSGQPDARIFFIPFFGAVTTARSMPRTAGARAAIALAGPLPGVVFGVLLAMLLPERGLGHGLAMMLLYVNVLNLLPIGFLDGGKVISSLFLSRFPVLEGAFAVASSIPLAMVSTGRSGSSAGILGGIAAGTAVAAVRRFRVVREARSVEPLVGDRRDALDLPEEALRALYGAAARIAARDKSLKGAKPLAAVMREVFEEACAPEPTTAERVGFGLVWAAALAIGWSALAAAGIGLLS